MFRPAGAMPVVAEVAFTGNKVIPEGALREAIRGVAIGARFTETRFRQLLDPVSARSMKLAGGLGLRFQK